MSFFLKSLLEVLTGGVACRHYKHIQADVCTGYNLLKESVKQTNKHLVLLQIGI